MSYVLLSAQTQCSFAGAWGGGHAPKAFYVSSYFWDRAVEAGQSYLLLCPLFRICCCFLCSSLAACLSHSNILSLLQSLKNFEPTKQVGRSINTALLVSWTLFCLFIVAHNGGAPLYGFNETFRIALKPNVQLALSWHNHMLHLASDWHVKSQVRNALIPIP